MSKVSQAGAAAVRAVPADVDAQFVEAVEAASHGLLGVTMRALAEVDTVSATQLRALMLLQSLGPVNLSVLAERLGVALSSASRLVDRLAASGHLERTVPAHSRREVLLTLSKEGRRVVRRHERARRVIFAELLQALDEQERECLLMGLRAVQRVTGDPTGVEEAVVAPA